MKIVTSKEGRAADHLSLGLIELEASEYKSTFKFLINHMKVAIPALRLLHAQTTGTEMPLEEPKEEEKEAEKFVRSEN